MAQASDYVGCVAVEAGASLAVGSFTVVTHKRLEVGDDVIVVEICHIGPLEKGLPSKR